MMKKHTEETEVFEHGVGMRQDGDLAEKHVDATTTTSTVFGLF